MGIEDVSNLKKAIFALLYDQYDIPDIELRDSDNTYVDYIVQALIEKNNIICPYKNYDCIENCESCTENCNGDELSIDCGKAIDEVWKGFIGIETNES